MQRLDTILATLVPHKEPILALLPPIMAPWPADYHSLDDSLRPIDPIEPLHHLDQTFNPTVSNVRSVSSPPMTFVARGQPSIPVISVPSNAMGKPPT